MSYRENAYRPPVSALSPELIRARRWMAIGAGFDAMAGTFMIVIGHRPAQGLILVGAAAGMLVFRHMLGRRWP